MIFFVNYSTIMSFALFPDDTTAYVPNDCIDDTIQILNI